MTFGGHNTKQVKDYTYFSFLHRTYSCIDYLLISKVLVNSVSTIVINTSLNTPGLNV